MIILHNSTYDGQTISKIVATYSNAKVYPYASNVGVDSVWPSCSQLVVYSDPTDGLWYTQIDHVTVNYQFYNSDGQLINFNNNNAWLTIASLNNHDGGTVEKATLDSAGQVDQIKGSSGYSAW